MNNNDKSFTNADNSLSISKANAPLAVLSRPKFQNVEKLTNLMRKIEQNSNRAVQPEQVVGAIKSTIRQNYARLYDNYEQNKTAIMRSVMQTETNQINDTQMRSRAENALKEKNTYDKLKAEVEAKQKKLNKLREIRAQLEKNKPQGNIKEILQQKSENVKQFEGTRQVLEYETAVLEQMKKQREKVKLVLKQRHDKMLDEHKNKKQRTQKLKDASHIKKMLLQRIQQKLRQEDTCQIPETLSEELEKKLMQVHGKYAQEEILRHEKVISEERSKQAIKTHLQEQEKNRKMRLSKEKEQLREFDMMENHYLLKRAQQEQIKRYCQVESLSDIADSNMNEQKTNLTLAKQRVEQDIRNLREQNEHIREQISTILTTRQTNNNSSKLSMLELQKQMDEQEAQLRRLRSHVSKKQSVVIGWQAVLQGILPPETSDRNLDATKLTNKLRMALGKYETYCKKEKIMEMCPTAPQTTELKSIKYEFNKITKNKAKKQNSVNKSSSLASEN